MTVRAANGRWGRYYLITPPRTDVDPLAVTYHKPVKGKLRRLSVSPKLMGKVLRQSPDPKAQSAQTGGTNAAPRSTSTSHRSRR